MPTISYALARADSHPTYVYLYDYPSDVDGGRLGAAHGAELPLLFDSPDSPMTPTYYQVPFQAGASRIGRELREAWASMARTGEPGWEPFRTANLATRVFGATSDTASYPLIDRVSAFSRQDRAPAPARATK
jgi:para-nitrobenzyl esterase